MIKNRRTKIQRKNTKGQIPKKRIQKEKAKKYKGLLNNRGPFAFYCFLSFESWFLLPSFFGSWLLGSLLFDCNRLQKGEDLKSVFAASWHYTVIKASSWKKFLGDELQKRSPARSGAALIKYH